MAANEILAAVSTDTGTNLLTQVEYAADAQRLTGNQPGIARSKLVNKMLRQASLVVAAIAQYIAPRQTVDVTDSLTAANLALYLHTAMNNSNVATVGGTADAITAAFAPAATVLQKGIIFWKAGFANATTTPTLQRDALAAKTLVKGGGAALVAGDIVLNGIHISYYDSTLDREVLLNPAKGVAVSTPFASNAEAQAGAVTDKAISPATLFAAFQGSNQSLVGDGYQKLPGGFIIQWMSDSTFRADGADVVKTWPVAFPNATLACVPCMKGISSATLSVSGLTTTQGTISIRTSSTPGMNLIVIGY